MKKIAFVLVWILIFGILIGCGKNDSILPENANSIKDVTSQDVYKSFVSDMANDGVINDVEIDWWTGASTQREDVPTSITISFDSVEYTGTYLYSRRANSEWEYTDYYQCDQYKDTTIGMVSGEFAYFFRSAFEDESLEILPDPYSVASKKADEYAKQYIDIEAYTLVERTYSVMDMNVYEFQYVKYVGKLPTSERLIFSMTDRGTIRLCSLHNIGAFQNVSEQSFDLDKVNNTVSERIKDLYAQTQINYEYEIDKQTLTYSPEGDLVVVLTIKVHFVDYSTGVVLAVIIS